MRILAIVQARTSSSRLPQKVLLRFDEEPIIITQLKRISRSCMVDKIVLATSIDSSDDYLAKKVAQFNFDVFRGSLNNVLDRFYQCANTYDPQYIIRLTGDCPFTDPDLIDEIAQYIVDSDFDYVTNAGKEDSLSVPDGFDIEIFTMDALRSAYSCATKPSQREHVTSWFRSEDSPIKWTHFQHFPLREFFRVTIDEPIDYWVMKNIYDELNSVKKDFGVDDVVKYLTDNPQVASKNAHIIRNEGYLRSLEEDKKFDRSFNTGQKLWDKAKLLIPGGNMLLSKRAEMFLPDQWPSYFSRAKGCYVWDLDGNKFTDMSIMGIGTNILGYGHPEVDEVVHNVINKGNMSSLNCPEEVYLSEKLVEMHGWAEMVRYTRSGGEANSLAIRIARAYTGKEVVAFCGYHGWHDWYLSANLGDNNSLSGHLLPGLSPAGVPVSLRGTAKPFSFNALHELEYLANNNELAAVKMEVQRSTPPDRDFLGGVRDLCDKKGIVLILMNVHQVFVNPMEEFT